MLRHADWNTVAVGVISGGPRERKIGDGTIQRWYWIEFDVPQSDLTDELNGNEGRTYEGATVLEPFLRPLSDSGSQR